MFEEVALKIVHAQAFLSTEFASNHYLQRFWEQSVVPKVGSKNGSQPLMVCFHCFVSWKRFVVFLWVITSMHFIHFLPFIFIFCSLFKL
jgi:hypothetical protein